LRAMEDREVVAVVPYQVAIIIGGLNRLAEAVRTKEVT